MEKKLGVYICTGCDIGTSLDMDKLQKVATDEYKAPICKTHGAFCSEEGVAIIKKDIESEGVNTVCIAACSERLYTDVFSFDKDIINVRAVIRDHCVWIQPPNHEDTQMMAEDYLRMGITKANKYIIPEPWISETMDRTVCVVGGGVTGLKAAIEAAKAKYDVVLIEKEDKLGGFANKLYKQLPTASPYSQIQTPIAASLISEVEGLSNIKVMCSTEIEQVAGQVGLFDVTVKKNGGSESFKAGAFVVATGWKPYDANKLDNLGYGKIKDVISNVEFEEMASQNGGKITRPSDGKEAKNVLFVQCAGSRDENHLPYCSAVCCMTSLKQASYVREMSQDNKAYIVYKDMITPAQYENIYKELQNDEGIFLTKGDIAEISESGSSVQVEVKNTLLGDDMSIDVDLVVLATGMVPRETDVLQLKYRQGTEIPTLEEDVFPDSHYICFPYESRRTGIYPAGPIRHPMIMGSSMIDGTGAALKAIQAIESYSRGEAVHPRAGDQSHPQLNEKMCTQCKRCTEECPFGALDEVMEDTKLEGELVGTPKPNPNRCRRCGICFGACPVRALNFDNYSMDMLLSMIKAIEVPEEDDEKPRMLGLFCENDAVPALEIMAKSKKQISPWIRFLPVRCLGSVNSIFIADSMNAGLDGVMLAGCKYGDDYQCHFIKGSEIANARMTNVQETLQNLALEEERVKQVEVSIDDYDKIDGIINGFCEEVAELEPNPFKDF